MKFAIILSCLISASTFGAYSVVMGQIKQMENFYSNIDAYVAESMNGQNEVENPYIPQPLQNMSQPLNTSTSQD